MYTIYKRINILPLDDIINCDNKNLTNHFDDSQWPKNSIKLTTFKGNKLVHVKPFPKTEIRKLILQKNQITKIDPAAFKQIINLTELDLSYNQLTGENLQPHVFEVKFICIEKTSSQFRVSVHSFRGLAILTDIARC